MKTLEDGTVVPEENSVEAVKEIYSARWIAHYKPGLGTAVVYGKDEAHAMKAALAEFRRSSCSAIERWPIDRVVDSVEPIIQHANYIKVQNSW